MLHAYSPAKPSPLSRILKLGDSPGSPPSKLPAAFPDLAASTSGVAELEEGDSPLRELAGDSSNKAGPGSSAVNGKKDKGKGKQKEITTVSDNPTAGKRTLAEALDDGSGEKENTIKRRLKGPAQKKTRSSASAKAGPSTVKTNKAGSSRAAAAAAVGGGKPGGARRVPINSAEAAPVNGRGWRG